MDLSENRNEIGHKIVARVSPSRFNFRLSHALMEYLSVYVFDWDLANIKISGLGVRILNDDILVPVDPSKRYDGSINQGLIGVSELGEGFPFPRNNRHWGFVFHDACWGLLCEGFQLDLNHLFLFYLSTYIGHCGLPCCNGDYGGVAQIGTNGQVIL